MVAQHTRNPFAILGVPTDADERTIRSAYRALAKLYHPDTTPGGSTEASNRRMAEINWAWSELKRGRTAWRVAVSAPGYSAPPREETSEEKSEHEWKAWQESCNNLRRDPNVPLGWRAWVGSDVICRDCGCILIHDVYRCPDCGRVPAKWKRSMLHMIVRPLRYPYWLTLGALAYAVAIPLLVGMLVVPAVLVMDFLHIAEPSAIWEWAWWRLAILAFGVASEAAVVWRWNS